MMIATLIVGCLIALSLSSASAQDSLSESNKWHGWWELGGYFSSDDTGRGEVTFFSPIGQTDSSILFVEAIGKLFEGDVREGNLALGHRQMLNSGWNFGMWGGLDVRITEMDNKFWQAAGGLEMLSESWDMRVNGYAPLTDPKSTPSTALVYLSGNKILMTGGAEVPLYGIDGEVGFKLFGSHGSGGARDSLSPGRRTELRVYGGGYYFDHEEALEEVAGVRTRVEFRIENVIAAAPGSRLTLESEYSHDDVRKDKWEIGAKLRIPFGGSRDERAIANAALSAQERRMTEGIERDTDIVTGESQGENVIDNATGVAMNQVAIANSTASMTAAVDTGSNTLIIVQDNGGQIDVSATDGQELQTSQTIQGGGSTIQVRGAKSGTVASFTAPGVRPTLFSNDNNDATGVLTLKSNTHVVGLNIEGNGTGNTHGARGEKVSNVVIEKNRFTTTGSSISITGIYFPNPNQNAPIKGKDPDLTIVDNTITASGGSAVFFGSTGSSNVTVSCNMISNANNGITFSENNYFTIVTNNTISNMVNRGVYFTDDNVGVTIKGNILTNIDDSGIAVASRNTDLLLSKNYFSDVATGGSGEGVFDFSGPGNSLRASSTGNTLTHSFSAGAICRGRNNFTGTLEVAILNSTLHTFTDAQNCGL